MKLTIITFVLLLGFNLKAQVNNEYYGDISNTTLSSKIEELVNLVIQDSLYKSFPYLINDFGSFAIISDGCTVYKNKRDCKQKINGVKHRFYFNPFSKSDSLFVHKQYMDTTSYLEFCSLKDKILISKNEMTNERVLSIEKPIFSKNFKNAYIKICIKYGNEISCHELFYNSINGVWIKIKEKNWLRS